MTRARRYLLTLLGCIMLMLGALGAVLPLLPTTPFLLAAAACFSRSFPGLEAWLLDHPRFGPWAYMDVSCTGDAAEKIP